MHGAIVGTSRICTSIASVQLSHTVCVCMETLRYDVNTHSNSVLYVWPFMGIGVDQLTCMAHCMAHSMCVCVQYMSFVGGWYGEEHGCMSVDNGATMTSPLITI